MLNPDRKNCVTASEIGAIVGRGRFATREDVMRRKVRELNGLPSEFQGNIATQWGHDHEAEAIAAYEFLSGETLIATGEVQKFYSIEIQNGDGTLLRAGCTPDGLVVGKGLVEVKCPYGKRNEQVLAGAYLSGAAEYYDQMQWQMLVTSTKACDFVVWSIVNCDYVTIERNFQHQEELIAAAMQFQRDLNAMMADPEKQAPYLQDKGQYTERTDAEFGELVEKYRNSAKLAAEYADIAETHRKELIAVCTNNTKGFGFSIIKSERKGSVDYSKVPELVNVNLDPYRKKSSIVWTVKEDKA